MRVIHRINKDGKPFFIFLSTYDERSVPAGLDFTWHADKKVWYTVNLTTARIAVLDGRASVDASTAKYLFEQEYLTKEEFATINIKPATRKEEAMEIAISLTPEMITTIHTALRLLAGVCDGAVQQDGVGFNGQDTQFGHELAARGSLTPTQAAYAKLMLRKYHGQLGDELYGAIWPEDLAAEQAKAAQKAEVKERKLAERESKQAEKDSAKEIKKAAGRGKVSAELAALLARLGTCDLSEYDEIEAQVRAMRMMGGRVQPDAAPATENQPQATQTPETAMCEIPRCTNPATVDNGYTKVCESCQQKMVEGVSTYIADEVTENQIKDDGVSEAGLLAQADYYDAQARGTGYDDVNEPRMAVNDHITDASRDDGDDVLTMMQQVLK